MCKYSTACGDVCPCLLRADVEGDATTACCHTRVPKARIDPPRTNSLKYAAVCSECGILKTSVKTTAPVKFAMRNHPDSHDVNWGYIR